MEAASFRSNSGALGGGAVSPLLRLQSDDRLVAQTRRGSQGAFETIVARYQSKLLGFCRHMLGNREDAEDVLQEVFAAAYTAMLADDRPIMLKPWLYRIARNRSLNHMRKAKPIGVDSMDIHVSSHGLTTADQAHRREEFRNLMDDINLLPETQRTALMLREMDGMAYEEIAEAMETTVPSVKSLLVRARIALAEMSEARGLTCDDVRIELGELGEGLIQRLTPPVKRHLKSCDRCKDFKAQLTAQEATLAAFAPVGAILAAKHWVAAQIGIGGQASATGGSVAASSASAGGIASSVSAATSSIASKAAAGMAAAAIVTAQVPAVVTPAASGMASSAAGIGGPPPGPKMLASVMPDDRRDSGKKKAAPTAAPKATEAAPTAVAGTAAPAMAAAPEQTQPVDNSATVSETDLIVLPADAADGNTGGSASSAGGQGSSDSQPGASAPSGGQEPAAAPAAGAATTS